MRISEFITLIIKRFGMEPTADQRRALSCFGSFLADRSDRCVMIMRGSAGTGKTSLAAAMVGTFAALGQKLQLMAPPQKCSLCIVIFPHLPFIATSTAASLPLPVASVLTTICIAMRSSLWMKPQ